MTMTGGTMSRGFILPGLLHNRSKSAKPVVFRVVVDNEPVGGMRVISAECDDIEAAKFDAELAIRKKQVDRDDMVVVQSSYTDSVGVETWYDQYVAQRPRGPKWRERCEKPVCETCESCGQRLPVNAETTP